MYTERMKNCVAETLHRELSNTTMKCRDVVIVGRIDDVAKRVACLITITAVGRAPSVYQAETSGL